MNVILVLKILFVQFFFNIQKELYVFRILEILELEHS